MSNISNILCIFAAETNKEFDYERTRKEIESY